MDQNLGLRERKKRATRDALSSAALRLAMQRGPENVRIDDIADAAGVSPRTYNNYFPSREHAIVAGVNADREERIAAAILAAAAGTALSDAVIDAVVEQYANATSQTERMMLMITASPVLRRRYAESVAMSEDVLANALLERVSAVDATAARVIAASVGAAARVAIEEWLATTDPSRSSDGLVVPTGSLADRLRASLVVLAPAIDAAVSD
ncbi:TetR/AcrR family transcriptional regulator [Cumulibacter soli]|uniref:TetR/AcrR family transcriptional regulator n=1 Tax=Cumulibacter soli TaxID=2546344 RepID=UPI00106791E4|nr:TetR/AcrR family transcriptional regulator [Cumulibacter soli]